MDCIRSGSSTRNLHASRHAWTMASYVSHTRAHSLLARKYSQTFSIGFNSGAYGGSGRSVILSGTIREHKASGSFERRGHTVLRASYAGHYRRMLPPGARTQPTLLLAERTERRVVPAHSPPAGPPASAPGPSRVR